MMLPAVSVSSPWKREDEGEGPHTARYCARFRIPPFFWRHSERVEFFVILSAANAHALNFCVILSAAKNPGSFSAPTTAPSTTERPLRRPGCSEVQCVGEFGILRFALE